MSEKRVETWLPVVGYEDFYEVSDAGRVRSLDRLVNYPDRAPRQMTGRILKGGITTDGYRHVGLSVCGQRKFAFVHRLVLEAFVGPCPPQMQGCHENGCRTDNWIANLRWDTPSANAFDRVRHGHDRSARKTHCPLGHAYDDVNTYRLGAKRSCRKCRTVVFRKLRAAA